MKDFDIVKKIVSNQSIKYVFVDCFETIVIKRYSQDIINYLWAQKVINKLHLDCSIDQLLKIRDESTTAVRLKKGFIIHEYSFEDLTKEIYPRLISNMSIEHVIFKEFYEILLTIEKENLISSLHSNEYILNQLRELKEEGYKIIILSDFHLDSETLDCILKRMNICVYDQIYSSCDKGYAKYSGKLYDYVLADIGIEAKEAIMIGNSALADRKMARKHGIPSLWYKEGEKYKQGLLHAELQTIFSGRKKAYDNYAFSLFLFIEKLYKEMENKTDASLCFLAREGEFLKKLFDVYVKENNLPKLDTHYIYTSRISSFVAGLQPLDIEKFEMLFDRYNDMSIRTFLKSIGMEDDIVETLKDKCKLDFDVIIRNFASSEEFVILKNTDEFREIYETRRNIQYSNLLAYFQQEGVSLENMYVVDVGWRGTIQDNLYDALKERGANITGYYLGLNKVNRANEKNNQKRGLIFSQYPTKSEYYDIWNFDKFMYERLLLASHPTTMGYVNEDGYIKPVLQEFCDEDAAFAYVKQIQDAILEKFIQLNFVMKKSGVCSDLLFKDFTQLHQKMLMHMGTDEIHVQKKLYDFNHESFGQFSRTDNKFWGTIKDAVKNHAIPYKKIAQSRFDLMYISSISWTTVCVSHHAGIFLIPFYKLLYKLNQVK